MLSFEIMVILDWTSPLIERGKEEQGITVLLPINNLIFHVQYQMQQKQLISILYIVFLYNSLMTSVHYFFNSMQLSASLTRTLLM